MNGFNVSGWAKGKKEESALEDVSKEPKSNQFLRFGVFTVIVIIVIMGASVGLGMLPWQGGIEGNSSIIPTATS